MSNVSNYRLIVNVTGEMEQFGVDMECPEDLVCFTQDEWDHFLFENENLAPDSFPMGDVESIASFTWEILFLSPWELAYIALPMGVLAFYGLSIYALFKFIQKRYT